MLVARNQPFIGDIRKIRAHCGGIDLWANDVDGDVFPAIGYEFALENVAVQRAGFCGYGDDFLVALPGQFYGGAGTGVSDISRVGYPVLGKWNFGKPFFTLFLY